MSGLAKSATTQSLGNKYWEDLTFDERIERMTQVIENQAYELRRVGTLINDLVRHQHTEAGKIYVPHDIGASFYDTPSRGSNPLNKKPKNGSDPMAEGVSNF